MADAPQLLRGPYGPPTQTEQVQTDSAALGTDVPLEVVLSPSRTILHLHFPPRPV
jgi:hypothetical protein